MLFVIPTASNAEPTDETDIPLLLAADSHAVRISLKLAPVLMYESDLV